MKEHKTLGRREFTVASAMAVLSGVAITVTGCGGGSSSPATPSIPSTPPPTGGGAGNDLVGTVGTNHGHSAVITAAQLAAADAVELDITGTSSHPHTVTLTAEEVGQIAGGAQVSKESSVDAQHSHTVTFN